MAKRLHYATEYKVVWSEKAHFPSDENDAIIELLDALDVYTMGEEENVVCVYKSGLELGIRALEALGDEDDYIMECVAATGLTKQQCVAALKDVAANAKVVDGIIRLTFF